MHYGDRLVIAAIVVLALVSVANGEVVTVEVTIKAVDVIGRTVTVEHKGKVTRLDLLSKATITVAGDESEASALVPGDSAKVSYDRDLEVITRIEAEGANRNGWRFFDVFNKGVASDEALVVAQDGRLVCLGNAGGYCLTSLRTFSEFRFSIEFLFPSENVKAKPYVSISSSLPNPKATDFTKQFPFGIEIKLHPDSVGEVVLPRPDFKVDLPLGQLRADRRVVTIQKAELKIADWNVLEVTCDEHKNVTVKVNGATVNALAKAENTKGYIVIFPQNVEMQFRSPVVVVGEDELPLSFGTIVAE